MPAHMLTHEVREANAARNRRRGRINVDAVRAREGRELEPASVPGVEDEEGACGIAITGKRAVVLGEDAGEVEDVSAHDCDVREAEVAAGEA